MSNNQLGEGGGGMGMSPMDYVQGENPFGQQQPQVLEDGVPSGKTKKKGKKEKKAHQQAQPQAYSVDPGSSTLSDFNFESAAFGEDPNLGVEVPSETEPADTNSVLRMPGRNLMRRKDMMSEMSDDPGTSVGVLVSNLKNGHVGHDDDGGWGELPRAVERLYDELIRGRRKIDRSVSDKTSLEERVEQTRARWEERHKQRLSIVTDQARCTADLEHITTELDFSRKRIEEMNREVAHLKKVRQAFGPEDFKRVERACGRLVADSTSSKERSAALASAHLTQEMLLEDQRKITSLGEQAMRASRRKLDLQARQQLLLEEQAQKDREKDMLQRELGEHREELESLRAKRLQEAQSHGVYLESMRRHVKETKLPPRVLCELLPRRETPAEDPWGEIRSDMRRERGHESARESARVEAPPRRPESAIDVRSQQQKAAGPWAQAMFKANRPASTNDVETAPPSGSRPSAWARPCGSGGVQRSVPTSWVDAPRNPRSDNDVSFQNPRSRNWAQFGDARGVLDTAGDNAEDEFRRQQRQVSTR